MRLPLECRVGEWVVVGSLDERVLQRLLLVRVAGLEENERFFHQLERDRAHEVVRALVLLHGRHLGEGDCDVEVCVVGGRAGEKWESDGNLYDGRAVSRLP